MEATDAELKRLCGVLLRHIPGLAGAGSTGDTIAREMFAVAAELLAARGGSVEQEGKDLGTVIAASDMNVRAESAVRLSQALAAKGARVAVLEAERDEWARKARAYGLELDAALKAGCDAAEVLAGDSGMLGEGLVNGARRVVRERDAAQQHISDLEKSLENARQERDTWRQCAEEREQAAQAQMADKHAIAKERDEALARLKPSGQVAEDERLVRNVLRHDDACPIRGESDECTCSGGDAADALLRLAAKAQGYEAAVADNAAMADLFNEVANAPRPRIEPTCAWCGTRDHHPICPVGRALSMPHPGAALLEEHRKALVRARNEGLETAAQASDDAADEAEARAEAASASPNPDAANWDNGAANEVRNIATAIRALKAPEPH